MSELARFQAAFAAAMAGDSAALAPWTRQAEPGLSVYRNTVAKGCVDAVAAQVPTVATVVGQAWLRDAAVIFARAHPPASPCLADYGAAFPGWLAGFPPAAGMPWLADLARIDRARTEALFAADAPPLAPQELAALPPDTYAAHALQLHPAARVLWFETGVPALWAALQAGPAEAVLAPAPQGLLIVRPALDLGHVSLSAGTYALLRACAAGDSLAVAGAAALAAEPALALAEAFAHLIRAGAFARLQNFAPRVS